MDMLTPTVQSRNTHRRPLFLTTKGSWMYLVGGSPSLSSTLRRHSSKGYTKIPRPRNRAPGVEIVNKIWPDISR